VLLAPPVAPRARDQLTTRNRREPASAGQFPEDPSFPQLEAARDPELMREVFQGHLRPLGGEEYQVRECRVSRIRHPANQCIVEYALRLEDLGTGYNRSQWVTGVMHAEEGRTRRMWEKLRRSEPERETPENTYPAFEPFSYLPDLGMLVQVFPYDRRLSALPLLMAGPPPELTPLLLARFGPGDWKTEAWDVEPIRYLAEKRATLRLTVRVQDAMTGRAEERRFYAKVYSSEKQAEQVYQVTRALWDKASAGEAPFTVGRPIAYLSDLQTLVQEEVLGTSLLDMLRQEDEATLTVRRVARALAALHLERVEAAPQRRLPRKEVVLERRGELLQQVCPHLEPRIEEIVGVVNAGLEEVRAAPTHGDLKPEHILLDGDRLALIDLDAFSEADPVEDAARLLAHLTSMPLNYALPHDPTRTVAQAFAEEYFAHVPEAWRARLPLHYADAVLRVAAEMAAGFLRGQAPGWPNKIEALLKEAEDSLVGRVW
jgi:hypothetical protein